MFTRKFLLQMWRAYQGSMEMKREMSVAGSFYPASKEEIEKYFAYFNKVYDRHFSLSEAKSKAVIVPHAGYVYSGFTANAAYRILQNSDIHRFVVIGPSHRIAFNGVSVCDFEAYTTPFGALQADIQIVQLLRANFGTVCIPQAHHEHSTEVQFPFIKHYMSDATLVEIVYSSENPDHLAKIVEFLLEQEDIGVIISTDLSHFHSLHEANMLDHICIDAIGHLELEKLHQGCEACGKIGVEAMLQAAKKRVMNAKIIDYRTSADVSNDTTSVVGYVSAYFS